MLYFYDLREIETKFDIYEDESTINPAINRWISGVLRVLQERINAY